MTDPLDDRTRRTRRELRAEREDAADETLLADRRTDDPTRTTARRVSSRASTGGTPIAHGRADTPRTASTPGTLVPRSVYGPRRADAQPPVVRTEVSPPEPVPTAPPPRRQGGVLLLVALAGAAVVAAAAWGIIVIVQGGFG